MIHNEIVLVGYSGHGFVIADACHTMGQTILGYYELEEVEENPFNLPYLGNENFENEKIKNQSYIVGVGDNKIRQKLINRLGQQKLVNVKHKNSIISSFAQLGKGVFINASAIINANTTIGDGVICNTACIVEHDCTIQSCAHIAPGAKLGGNVNIGKNVLVGIGAIILPGVTIGDDSIIGAGSIITKDIPKNHVVTSRSKTRCIPIK